MFCNDLNNISPSNIFFEIYVCFQDFVKIDRLSLAPASIDGNGLSTKTVFNWLRTNKKSEIISANEIAVL